MGTPKKGLPFGSLSTQPKIQETVQPFQEAPCSQETFPMQRPVNPFKAWPSVCDIPRCSTITKPVSSLKTTAGSPEIRLTPSPVSLLELQPRAGALDPAPGGGSSCKVSKDRHGCRWLCPRSSKQSGVFAKLVFVGVRSLSLSLSLFLSLSVLLHLFTIGPKPELVKEANESKIPQIGSDSLKPTNFGGFPLCASVVRGPLSPPLPQKKRSLAQTKTQKRRIVASFWASPPAKKREKTKPKTKREREREREREKKRT